ncbi:MAG: ankyrin repeat domain-containing protein [Candidatus Brocadiae bacterium]|nr:ankyrin repeat domain-containing protein [Candidatus Brocadiia bacterium]
MAAHWKLPVWVTLVICSALTQVSCDGRGVEGFGPLHGAVRGGYLEQVEQLIEQGADVNARTAEGETPLHYAAVGPPLGILSARQVEAIRRATPEIITALLQAGARIEAREVRGLTPLQYAATERNVDAVRVLVENGANVNTRDRVLRASPLMRAASGAPLEVVQLLLAAGADIHARDRLGSTALHSAAGGLNEQAVDILLDSGADVNAQDDRGSSPLRYALNSLTGRTVAELLLERGAKHDVFTVSALGELGLLRSMLEQDRALTGARHGEGRTPLHWAARWGEVSCAEVLLEYGADCDSLDLRGMSPLALAAGEGHVALAELLRHHGATE